MTFQTTATFAATLGILIALLSFIVVIRRAKSGISLGHANNETLHRAIRAHANTTEFVPVFLIVLGLLEVSGTSATWLAWLGIAFVAGRVLSAYYFLGQPVFAVRVVAFWATVLPITIACVLLLVR